MPDRRSFCAILVGATLPATFDVYRDRNLIIHVMLPQRTRPYRVGEVLRDPQCGRHFRLVKMVETPSGLLAKFRWVSRIDQPAGAQGSARLG